MKSVKRHLSLICVVALVLAIMVPTVFAATTGYNYTYSFNLGSGGSKTYDGKDEKDFWYPSDEAATWSINVNSNSKTYVDTATLYYIRSLKSDVEVETMSGIGAGSSDSRSFVGIDGKTYYAVINAMSNAGVYGTTNLSQ
ncbi:MAG TPA: hypothetical protein DGZ34_09225 [Lachnospiraceae bacterium]|jgi:hypothetical protein|nr:hypothetical protein [Lachnospiraceae bacterium]